VDVELWGVGQVGGAFRLPVARAVGFPVGVGSSLGASQRRFREQGAGELRPAEGGLLDPPDRGQQLLHGGLMFEDDVVDGAAQVGEHDLQPGVSLAHKRSSPSLDRGTGGDLGGRAES
jgi:hypothetical protein